MDCSTARLFLPFHRPGGRDLDGPEAADLDRHLAHCTECNGLAMTQTRLDQTLGKAMRAVEVPRGLRVQILERLAAQPTRKTRWLAYSVRGLSAAAAVLLLVVGWYVLYNPARRTLDAAAVFEGFNLSRAAQTDKIDAQLRQLGARAGSPNFVDYTLLTGSPALAILPGTEEHKSPVTVPQLVFQYEKQTAEKQTAEKQTAVVYVVSRKKFRIDEPINATDGYAYRLEVVQPEGSEFAYFVLYTGSNWDWLKVAEAAE